MADLSKPKSSTISGFTLVEMLVIAPLVLLLIGGIVASMVQATGEVVSVRAKNNLTYNLQDALNRVENDIELSVGFLATTDTAFDINTPQGVNNNTQDFVNASSTDSSLLLAVPLTTKSPTDSTRQLVYLANNPNACTHANVTNNRVMTGVVAYFVKDNTLWRRLILPPNYLTAGCASPWQQPSCQPGIAGAFCKTEDIELLSGVSGGNFNIAYFANASSSSPISSAANSSNSHAVRQSGLSSATTAEVSITSEIKAGGDNISQNMKARSTRIYKGSEYTP